MCVRRTATPEPVIEQPVIQCVRADKLFEAFAPVEPKFNDLFSIGKVARVLVQVKFAFLISTGNDLH